MKVFEERDRYELPHLTPDSVIVDIGMYEGQWGRLVVEKYDCTAFMFEPIRRFYEQTYARLQNHPQREKMKLHNMGISGHTHEETFKVQGDMTGPFADGPEEKVYLLGIEDLMNAPALAGKNLGCLKINAEGSEYPILERMLELNLLPRVDELHVQPHTVVPDYATRWAAIVDGVNRTHSLIWAADWCWFGWRRKGLC